MMKGDDMSTLPLIDIHFEGFNSPDIPASPGIYAIYNDKKELQYVGLSRKISASIKMHCFELPAECGFAKVLPMEEATKVDLQGGWKRWVMAHVSESGGVCLLGILQRMSCGRIERNAVLQNRVYD